MEKLNRQVLRKSLVAKRFLPTGTVVTRDLVDVKGPGKGLSPQRLPELLGVELARDIEADDYFVDADLRVQQDLVLQTGHFRHPWGLKARFHDLADVLVKEPQLVELHFSDADVDYPFAPPPEPYTQQLFVHAPEFFDQQLLDLATFDEERREASIALLQRTIAKTAALAPSFAGIGGIVIHVGGMSMDGPAADRERLLQRAAAAFRRLDSRGLALLPENLPPRPWYLGGQWFQNVFIRPEEMVEFCQDLDVGMTLDLSHAQLYCTAYGRSLLEYIDLCLPYTRHVHISDSAGIDGEGLQIGEGVVEWEAVLERLAGADFTWVPEIWSGHLHGGAGFVEAINRLSCYQRL
jgi:N-acetylneuraminate synthase